MSAKKISVFPKISITLGVVGVLVAVIAILGFELRDFGGAIFKISFYIFALGAISSVLLMNPEEIPYNLGPTIKMASVGFGIIVFSYAIESIVPHTWNVGSIGFYIGIIVMILGILRGFFRFFRQR